MSAITFSDVLFEPQYSEVMSRSSVDLSSDMGKFKLSLPVISANMKDVTGPKMCHAMYRAGGVGILHRFRNPQDSNDPYGVNLLRNTFDQFSEEEPAMTYDEIAKHVGVSIGVKEDDKHRFYELFEAGARIFCIDVAQGHHILVKNMIKWIRIRNHLNVTIIAGNVATIQGAKDLREWGADIIKVGIGPGEACQTRKNTGVGVPQLSAIRDIRQAIPDIVMISDGGIKTTGDIAKAMKYANAVMIGSFIAGASETPGNVYESPDGQFYKVFGGSASGERKVENGGKHAFVEGVVKMVPFRGHVRYLLKKIKENLQSSFSYSGANNLKEFQEKSVLIEISGGARLESKI